MTNIEINDIALNVPGKFSVQNLIFSNKCFSKMIREKKYKVDIFKLSSNHITMIFKHSCSMKTEKFGVVERNASNRVKRTHSASYLGRGIQSGR